MGSEEGRHIRSIGVAMVTWGLLGLLPSIRAIAQEDSEKLTQRNSGIAVKYPGDEGIERDPAVVFTENFEHAGMEAVGKRWSEVSNKEGKVLALSDVVPPGSAGKHSVQMTGTLGEDSGGHLHTNFQRGV